MPPDNLRLLIVAAHPDDAEYYAGGLAALYRQLGRVVRIIAISDGGAGHHTRPRQELISIRRDEAARAGRVIDCAYETLHFPDGELQPTLELRRRIIREIRKFQPDLIVTHRTCDYHPDHQAVGQAVQDSSYLITVPRVEPDVPAVTHRPVIAFMADTFTRPTRMRADAILDTTELVSEIAAMLACHESQVFEWLPYEEGILSSVPTGHAERRAWLLNWFANHARKRADHFRRDLQRAFGSERGDNLCFVEVYEISEYGAQPDEAFRRALFPQCVAPARVDGHTTHFVDGSGSLKGPTRRELQQPESYGSLRDPR